MHELEVSLDTAFESDNEGAPPKPTTGQPPAPAVNQFICNRLLTELKDAMMEMGMQAAQYIFAEQTGQSRYKAAEDALSDGFLGEFKEVNTGHKNKSYYFLGYTFTKMATKGSSEDMFELNLKS